ncbi:hypothetical protein HN51_031111 [Arachis hypogaea]|uniref:Uncharacterized protein n=1 Tax=Arachis hypogaea TaxID=3818 RepID=A0A445B8K6_ARAHY|nr:uncharacterized protein LOC112715277 [Arachis hypogaea]RYR35001.1 hypothetical protein Ahy_A10g050086 [Arachis hypogaea]
MAHTAEAEIPSRNLAAISKVKMEMKGAERRRRLYPLSDRTNSSSSNNFNKSVTKCNSLLPLPPPPPALCSGTHERRNNHNKEVTNPQQNVSNIRGGSDEVEALDLLEDKHSTVPCRKKQRCMSNQQKKSKNSQLQDFIEKQNAYYKEVDDFVLSVEEVESIHELE